MRSKKTYHFAPNEEYPPGSVISLGRIWTSPTNPSSSLFHIQSEVPPFPENMPIQSSWKKGWRYDEEKSRTRVVGLLANFLETVLRVDLGGRWTSKNGRKYQIEKVETDWVIPTDEYITEAVASLEVQRYIIEEDFKKNIFMVTGVKVARGAAKSQESSRERIVGLTAQADTTTAGAPGGSIGPKISFQSGGQQHESFEESSDFVFAYRLQKIYYEKFELKNKPYSKGAMLQGLKERTQNVSQPLVTAESRPVVKALGLAKADVGADGTGLKVEFVKENDDDDESECSFVLPPR